MCVTQMFVLLCVHVSCMWVHTPEGISMWNTEIDLHILSRVINLSFGDTVSLWLGWGSLIQPDWLAKIPGLGLPCSGILSTAPSCHAAVLGSHSCPQAYKAKTFPSTPGNVHSSEPAPSDLGHSVFCGQMPGEALQRGKALASGFRDFSRPS